MKEVDELIDKLAIHISEVILSGKERDGEIAEKTKALAELMSARAKFLANEVETKIDVKSTEELADIVVEHLRNTPECQKKIRLSSFEIFRGKQTP